MALFKNKTNKRIRLDSRTYIDANETKELDNLNRNVQMYVAIRYLEKLKETPVVVTPEAEQPKRSEPVVAPAQMIVAPELPEEIVEEVKTQPQALSFTPIPEPSPVLSFEDGEEKKTSKRKKKNDE
jgi:hypothetical protein